MDVLMFVGNDVIFDSRVKKEAMSLASRGWKVLIMGVNKNIGVNRFSLKEGIEVLLVPSIFDYLKNKLRKKSFNSRSVAGRMNLFYLYALDLFVLLAILFRNISFFVFSFFYPPKVYHAHDLDSSIAPVVLAKLKGKHFIYDSHELWLEQREYTNLFKLVMSKIEKYVISSADHIFTVNPLLKNRLCKKYNISPEKITVTMNCAKKVNINWFNGTSRVLKVVYVGGYLQYRDFSFLEILNLPYVDIYMVGPGLEKLKVNYPYVNYVHPFLDHEKLITFLSRMDVGLIPTLPRSKNDKFSSPNKLFEYMMAGLVILSTNLPFIENIIKECHNGKCADISEWPTFLKELLRDRQKLSAMKKNSRSFAIHKYNWEIQEKKLLKVYQSLLYNHKNVVV